ncbi:MAG: winged helix-turn-helix domain-containing protein [Candidatus Nitrotoga sp.]|nr:winged helix-turn-helix domain-containing protein [Candidatus Nitrotoga sp.]
MDLEPRSRRSTYRTRVRHQTARSQCGQIPCPLGFTPQKPIKRAYEQNPEAVQSWPEGEYPGIEQRARQEGAEIYWGDETALVNTDVRGRSFAASGQNP